MQDRDVTPFKAVIAPTLGTRTVLTNSPWGFVSLWLKRNKKDQALFFWNQAREFHEAALQMSLQSSPLLHYYAFMNAAKSLLSAKGVAFDQHHGVVDAKLRKAGVKIALSNEGVKIRTKGVLPALSSYLREAEVGRTHSLQDLFFNLPFIHRTYCLTYINQANMFISLTKCRYVVDTTTMQCYLQATLSRNFLAKKYIKQLPGSFVADPAAGSDQIRSARSVRLSRLVLKAAADETALISLNNDLRRDLLYINGAETLWYVKGIVSGASRLERYPVTLALAAMHRMSELCRYKPFEFQSLLSGQRNWLLSEFVEQAPQQYIDELATEITGYNFMVPNVRAAT